MKTNSPPPESPSKTIQIESTNFLKSWDVTIQLVQGNNYTVAGYTETYSTVDKRGLKLYLQVWDPNNSNWVDVKQIGDYSKSSSYVEGSVSVSLSSGYYYRARGVHYAVDNNSMEEVGSFSGYIYVE